MSVWSFAPTVSCATIALFLSPAPFSAAWAVSYDGSVLPNDPSLGADAWQLHDYYAPNDLSKTSASEGVLHLVDDWSDRSVLYRREGEYLPAGSSVTIEARVRVLSGSHPLTFLSPVLFGAQVGLGANAQVYIWADKIGTRYSSDNHFTILALDMTQYHTIRLAVDSGVRFGIWVDGTLAFAGKPLPGYRGSSVYFTTGLTGQATSDSYWDYVRYSLEYLPVPEPSGLVALGAGLAAILTTRRRSRE